MYDWQKQSLIPGQDCDTICGLLDTINVKEMLETAMKTFDSTSTDYCFDTTPGRIIYFYFNPQRYFKYIRPVKRR